MFWSVKMDGKCSVVSYYIGCISLFPYLHHVS